MPVHIHDIDLPIILVNFKTYENAEGRHAAHLARVCQRVAETRQTTIGIAVSALDLRMVKEAIGNTIPVFAQHVDPVEYGAHTGYIVPEEVRHAGAVGTILNHAEHKLPWNFLQDSVRMAQQHGLFVCCCASSMAEAKKIKELKPTFVAYEPPSLIGGDISVSSAKTNVIADIVALYKDTPTKVLVGAGVKTKVDVQIALRLGAKGVLLASGVTKAAHPKMVLEQLAEGTK